MDEYPLFIGYGTTGISNNEKGITDTGDLVVFYSPNNWSTIQISFFRGLGNPDYLLKCMEFLNNGLKETIIDMEAISKIETNRNGLTSQPAHSERILK